MKTKKLKPGQHRTGPKTKVAKVRYFADGVRAMDMRVSGMSWGEIAEALNIQGADPPSTALKMARDARAKIEQETAEEQRLVQHDRYELMYKSLVPKIVQGRERAIEVAAGVLRDDAKLMGINADAEKQGNFQPIFIQIQADPNDAEARKLAAKDLVIEQRPRKLLSPPDKSV